MKFLKWVVLLAFAYLLILIALGFALQSRVESLIVESLKATLRADTVEISQVDLSVLRGHLYIEGITAQRSGIGTTSVGIESIEVDFASLGLSLFNRSIDLVLVSGAHVELSAVGAATLGSRKSKAVQIEKFIVRDSSVTFVPTSYFPGVGKTTLSVLYAEAVSLTLDNSLSWLYKTQRLDAKLETPGDLDFLLSYGGGEISVGASIFGSVPIRVPFAWPEPDPRKWELSQLLDLGTQLAKILGKEYAKRKAKGLWDDVVELVE